MLYKKVVNNIMLGAYRDLKTTYFYGDKDGMILLLGCSWENILIWK